LWLFECGTKGVPTPKSPSFSVLPWNSTFSPTTTLVTVTEEVVDVACGLHGLMRGCQQETAGRKFPFKEFTMEEVK